MAIAHTICGEYDKALDDWDVLLATGTLYTVRHLQTQKDFEPLRMLPRYKELIKKYALPAGT